MVGTQRNKLKKNMCSTPLHLYQLPVRHRLQVDRSKGQNPSTKILPLTGTPHPKHNSQCNFIHWHFVCRNQNELLS